MILAMMVMMICSTIIAQTSNSSRWARTDWLTDWLLDNLKSREARASKKEPYTAIDCCEKSTCPAEIWLVWCLRSPQRIWRGGPCFWWYKTGVSACNRYVRLKYTQACKSWQGRKHRYHVNITKQKYKCQFLINTNTDTNLNTNTNAPQFLSKDKIWCRLCNSCKNM